MGISSVPLDIMTNNTPKNTSSTSNGNNSIASNSGNHATASGFTPSGVPISFSSGSSSLLSASSTSVITSLLNNASSTKSDAEAYKAVNKPELINLIIQSLNDLGLKKSSKALKEEASAAFGNVGSFHSSTDNSAVGAIYNGRNIIDNFIGSIQSGNFEVAEALISQLSLKDDLNSINNASDIYCYGDLKSLNNSPFTTTPKLKNLNLNLSDQSVIEKQILLLIKKQKFLEQLLLHKNSKVALNILKVEISQTNMLNCLPNIKDEINILSSLIIDESSHFGYLAKNGFNLKHYHSELSDANLRELEVKSRNFLINRLSKYIAPDQLLPPHRLLTLLQQARTYQQSQNLLTLDNSVLNHETDEEDREQTNNKLSPRNKLSRKRRNSTHSSHNGNKDASSYDKWSLYENYKFPIKKFPCKVLQTLKPVKKQIWYVKFSNNGKYLAVASQDKSIYIYHVGDYSYEHQKSPSFSSKPFRLHKVLKGHTKSVLYCSWINDDSKLLSSGFDSKAKIWDAKTGTCLQTIHVLSNKDGKNNGNDDNGSRSSSKRHSDEMMPVIRACEWLPNGKGFIIGSTEKELVYFDANGNELYRWSGIRIYDLCISKDSKKLITVSETKVDVWDLATKKKTRELMIGKKVTSATVSQSNSNQILVHVVPDSIQLWDWNRGILLKKFVGQKQEEFVVRSCFGGGKNENLIISGSEDGKVYIWNKKYSALVLGLKGHKKLVNCVDYNPKIPWMFASASDDETINIWGPEEALELIKKTHGNKSLEETSRASSINELINDGDDGDNDDDDDDDDDDDYVDNSDDDDNDDDDDDDDDTGSDSNVASDDDEELRDSDDDEEGVANDSEGDSEPYGRRVIYEDDDEMLD